MFDNYIEDAVAWLNFLKTDLGYERIFIIGHSEGSLIGMAAANRTKISGFISIAGTGRSIDLILRDQLKNLPLNLLDQANKILDSLKAGKTYADIDPGLMAYFRPSVQSYLISWMKYDPVKEISKLRIPTLILHGSDDLQVTGEEALILSQAKPNATLLYIDKMNHVLKDSGADVQQNTASYKNPELPLHAQLIDVIVQFIAP
jgi:pimeloyl-ACP methyl ester carboxylesterase